MMRRSLCLLFLAGCSSSGLSDGNMMMDGPAAPKLVWQKGLAATDSLQFAQTARGLRVVRGIIHLHSVYSHDACDGNPQPGGQVNAPCLLHLRDALCKTHQDFALLTDHAVHMTEAPFQKLFLTDTAAGDEVEQASGEPGVDVVGGRLRCDDKVATGHRVHLAVGGENELMPVALRRHIGSTPEERAQAMHGESLQAEQAFHDAGGAVLVAHGESRSIDLLRQLAPGLDGMEVYNLHANIDPKIREGYLGLPGLGAVAGLAPWLAATPVEEGGPEPDLAFVGFLEANRNQIDKFDTLLAEGHSLLPVLGSDIHENAFKQMLADGERGDSYRRLMRWFGNHLLLPKGPLSTAALRDAILHGRGYGVFHLFGEPEGFDFHAKAASGPSPSGDKIFELGDTAPLGATLHVAAPRPLPRDDLGKEPVLRLSLIYVAAGGTGKEVVATRLATAAELSAGVALTFDTASRAAGAYRVEASIVPRHLLHLLGENASTYAREYPYLFYSGPIYVK
jgi:hypothetical protein